MLQTVRFAASNHLLIPTTASVRMGILPEPGRPSITPVPSKGTEGLSRKGGDAHADHGATKRKVSQAKADQRSKCRHGKRSGPW